MSQRFLACVAALVAGAGLVLAQSPQEAPLPPKPAAEAPAPVAAAPAPLASPEAPVAPAAGPPADGSLAVVWQRPDCVGNVLTVGLEYSLWYLPKSRNATVLASTSVLNDPAGIRIANVGDERLERRLTSGGRLTVGWWEVENDPWAPGHTVRRGGWEGRLFAMAQKAVEFRTDSQPTLVRPFFDLNNRRESAVIVALPGLATGGIASRAEGDFWGFEVNWWRNLFTNNPGTTYGVDLLAGVRYLHTDPEITISRISVFNQDLGNFPAFLGLAGNRIQEDELFGTRNQFFGGQVGILSKYYTDYFVLEGTAKLALGFTHEQLHIEGSQQQTLADGSRRVLPGALLALPTNIGRVSRDKFAFVPELGFSVAVPVFQHVTLTGAFNAIYWSRIIRPRDQIDRVIDVTQIPNFPAPPGSVPTGLQRPTVLFDQTDLWALGFHFGLEVTW